MKTHLNNNNFMGEIEVHFERFLKTLTSKINKQQL